ncbi:hypothetical protein ACGFNU_44285 [Spirillospora sp. NPDC048911]|uniref:hypothetical protein n=1 Tax=Spirillospora sp. NPDC048911 TaxID=3364527 RepID=UPI0037245BEB
METLLSASSAAEEVLVASPWDVWWVCYRFGTPLDQLGIRIRLPEKACPTCATDAMTLASASPPGHPDLDGARLCGCLLEWAVRMRAPGQAVTWPSLSLTLALLKPGAPRNQIRAELERTHQVIRSIHTTLTIDDTRRLYPEAYGAEYVAARDAYLTKTSVVALVLLARHDLPSPGSRADLSTARIKERIRAELGGSLLRNHLHMPDNPGEALADIAHLAGDELLPELYERYECDRVPHRLAFYRTALGIGSPAADRHPAWPY